MINTKNNKKLLGSSILLAFTSSLCCIVPLLAIFGSAGSFLSMFSWLESIRPYLLGATALALAIAFYQAYKSSAKDNCGCEEKKTGLHSKTFLWIVAFLSLMLATFPNYAPLFQKTRVKQSIISNSSSKQSVLHIRGMSCPACEGHINQALESKKGVQSVITSYEKGQTVVKFDSTQVSLAELTATVEKETGYKITNKSTNVN